MTLQEFKEAIEVITDEVKEPKMSMKDKIKAKRAKRAASSSASSASSSSELNLAGDAAGEGRMRGGSNDNVSVDYVFVSGICFTTTPL